MRLKRAEWLAKAAEIVEKTIKAIYPHYYPSGIDASFPAESMYLKKGYRIKTYEIIETEGEDYLCYYTMEKEADRTR